VAAKDLKLPSDFCNMLLHYTSFNEMPYHVVNCIVTSTAGLTIYCDYSDFWKFIFYKVV